MGLLSKCLKSQAPTFEIELEGLDYFVFDTIG
jgi:hypothetical protein